MLAMSAAAIICIASPSVSMADTTRETKVVEKTATVKKPVAAKKHTRKRKKHRHTVVQKQTVVQTQTVVQKPKRKQKQVVQENYGPKTCKFLIWDVECASHEDTMRTPETVALGPTTKTVEKGLTMVGMSETDNREELKNKFTNTFGYKIDPVHIPWCAAWVNVVLNDSGVAGTNSLAARSFLNWGSAVNRPEQGDIVVFRRGRNRYSGHVGFYINTVMIEGRKYIGVLGGNQDRKVSIAYYAADNVLGYRKPVFG